LVMVTDPAGRQTALSWCGCGSLGGLTDSNGHVTQWFQDLQGQPSAKVFCNSTSINYFYSDGLLVTRYDAMGTATTYTYNLDDTLQSISYSTNITNTPGVSYTYDPAYKRLVSMKDSFGTTTYQYYPITVPPQLGAGRLKSVTSPFANSIITYTYDNLGRIAQRAINGVTETRGFDALGRLSSITNPLGSFSYHYDGSTSRLASILFPAGQQANFAYYDALNLFRLKNINNLKSDTTPISLFAYTYDVNGQIQTWSKQTDVQAPNNYAFGYDSANQITSALLSGPNGALLHQFSYGYDLGGNLTSDSLDGSTTTSDFNNLNQLVTQKIAPTNPAASAGSPGSVQAPKSTGK